MMADLPNFCIALGVCYKTSSESGFFLLSALSRPLCVRVIGISANEI